MRCLYTYPILSSHQGQPNNVKVCCVMPCYDKKLEAVRPDLKFGEPQKEVDTVLATHELIELFERTNIDLANI